MSPDQGAEIVRRLLIEAMILSFPLLAAAALISLLLSVAQTVTSIQEQTLTSVPRLVLVALVAMLAMPWYVRRLVTYTIVLFTDFHRYLG